MSFSRASTAAAVAGALVVQVLPLTRHARAAWCWTAQPPRCAAPVVAGGSCEEGATIEAGGSCTPKCETGKVPEGSCTILCPASQSPAESAQCLGDLDQIDALPWWNFCSFGASCVGGDYQLGTPDSQRFGTFTCVDAASSTGSCEVVEARRRDKPMDWDGPTILVAVWNVGLLIVGAVLARLSMAATSKFFQDGSKLWSAANVLGVALAVAALVLYTVVLGVDDGGNRTVFLTGLATGLALPSPMFFAMFRAGAEDVLKMSRERAWRVHTFLGDVALIFATVHGIFVMRRDEGNEDVPEPELKIWWVFGLIALALMWLGVVPVVFQSLHLDKLFSYDKFKIMHYLSAIGVIFAVIHMLDHAITFGTARSWLVTIFNIAALALFTAQRVWVSATSSVESVTASVIGRSGGEQYVTLSLKASRFAKAYKPGQWGHLTYNSVIKHPFTCTVTDEDPDTVKMVIKVSGSWTSKLAQACAQGTPKLKLEGPYGVPPLQPNIPAQYDAVVFVLGGVGVTPALSLVPLAKESGFKQVHFFWSLRSSALLEHCAPFLDSRLTPEHSCIRLTSSGQAGQLPLGARMGRQSVGEWLTETAKTISGAGARSALVFICGPHALAAAAHKALGGSNSQVNWHIHAEQFAFLPQFVPPRTSGRPSAVSEQPNLLGKANES